MSAEESQARIVVRYAGAHIESAHKFLRVVFTEKPRLGVRSALHVHNYERCDPRIYQCRMTTQAIFETQSILQEFYGRPLP